MSPCEMADGIDSTSYLSGDLVFILTLMSANYFILSFSGLVCLFIFSRFSIFSWFIEYFIKFLGGTEGMEDFLFKFMLLAFNIGILAILWLLFAKPETLHSLLVILTTFYLL